MSFGALTCFVEYPCFHHIKVSQVMNRLHHCKELVEMIETDISFAIFGVSDEEISILQRNLRKKDLEDTRSHHEAARPVGPLGQTDRWAPGAVSHCPLEASSTDYCDASEPYLRSV